MSTWNSCSRRADKSCWAVKLPSLSPLVAIGEEGNRHVFLSTAHECKAAEGGAVGERLVVGAEELFRVLRAGHDDHRHGPEAEVDDGPILVRKPGEVSM